jgi:excisionase family DNA binding protein
MRSSIVEPPSISSQTPKEEDSASKSYSQFEPLLDSEQAARLLGNIHVKTLQRYARLGVVPSYRIGSHWFFRESELDAWVRSQINSSCRPCR